MHFETTDFKISLKGLSRDNRTNKWSVVSKCCKKYFEPDTTMLRVQTLECPKCGRRNIVDYNEQKELNNILWQRMIGQRLKKHRLH